MGGIGLPTDVRDVERADDRRAMSGIVLSGILRPPDDDLAASCA